MLTRQKIILSFLRHAQSDISRIFLVKLCFLLSQEYRSKKNNTFYQFCPYQYGPSSFNLYHEIDQMINDGIIERIGKNNLSATKKAYNDDYMPDDFTDQVVGRCYSCYGKMNINQLIDYVYSNYRWYTLKARRENKRLVHPIDADIMVYTVGYEGYQIDGFLNLLLQNGIEQIIDVRYNPLSRKFGFHKERLRSLCEKLDINYTHIQNLGIPPQYRNELKNVDDYVALFEFYEKEIITRNMDSVKLAVSLMEARPSVLMCQEAEPECCHRTRLAKYVSSISKLDICNLGGRECLPNMSRQGCLLQ